MINLLNSAAQKEHHAARTNLRLRGYLVLLLATFIGVVLIYGSGLFLTINERATANTQTTANSQLTAQYAPVRAKADAFAANLRTAKAILSQEVLYSDMITKIANTLPANTVLSSLALNQQTLKKPITLAARVKAKQDAIVLKSTLENSPLFESVNINNISEENIADTETNQTKISHPVIVTISMTLSHGQPGSLLP